MGAVLGFEPTVTGTNGYEETAGSDVVVDHRRPAAAAGHEPRRPRDDEREDRRLGRSSRSSRSRRTRSSIVLSNPLDAMCHVAKNVSGFPKERVFGQAGILDTARFRTFIAWETGSSVKDVQALVLGGHGDQMVPVVSATTVGGVPLTQARLAGADRRDGRAHREGRRRGGRAARHLRLVRAGRRSGADGGCGAPGRAARAPLHGVPRGRVRDRRALHGRARGLGAGRDRGGRSSSSSPTTRSARSRSPRPRCGRSSASSARPSRAVDGLAQNRRARATDASRVPRYARSGWRVDVLPHPGWGSGRLRTGRRRSTIATERARRGARASRPHRDRLRGLLRDRPRNRGGARRGGRERRDVRATAGVLEREAERLGALAGPRRRDQPADVKRLVERAVEAFGGIDILVNNGGGPPRGAAVGLTDEQVEAAVELLLVSAVRLTELCLPHLERSGPAASSTSSRARSASRSTTSRSRMRSGPGVIGWAKTLAREVGPEGDHRQLDRARADRHRAPRRGFPRAGRRRGPPADPAAPLRRDRARSPTSSASSRPTGPRYVTGAVIPVDGGLTRGLL